MKSRWCSSSASISGDAPARRRGFNGGGEGEAPPWLGVRERESSLSEWDEGERVEKEEWLTRGVREGTWRQVSACMTRTRGALADRPRVSRGLSAGGGSWQ